MSLTKQYEFIIPGGATAAASSHITMGETYDKIWITRGAFASVTTSYPEVSNDGSTFKRVIDEQIGEHAYASSASHIYEYNTSVSGYWVPFPAGFPYIRVGVASKPTGTVTFTVLATKFGV